MKDLLTTYRGVFIFLLKFLGLYFILNLLYGFLVEYHYPQADPVTHLVARHVVSILGWFGDGIESSRFPDSPYIGVYLDKDLVIRVYEGCNSMNVMIVYLCFLIAFTGPARFLWMFAVGGFILIYLMNLLRVILLYEIALYFPNDLYFYHKYLFTGIIYLVVFVLWYFWIKTISKIES